jgi:hypothetical protein
MRRPLGILLCLALTLPVRHAQAAPPTGAVATEAREHFKRGTALYEEADYRAALAEFKRAYEILPNAAVLFNIGQSYYQLNEYVSALQTFQKYLAEKDPTGASRRTLATKELEELKHRVTTLQIETSVPGAEITVDDQVIGASPQATMVAVGRRKIGATLAGHRPITRTVDVASGTSPPVVLELVEDKPEPAQPPPPSPPPSQDVPGRTSPLVLGAFGVGAVGLVTGSLFGLLALGNRSALGDKCTTRTACPEDARSDKDALERNGTIATIGFAVAAIGAGTGLVLLLTQRGAASTGSSPQRQMGLFVGPMSGIRATF